MSTIPNPGDRVRLLTPDNARLDGQLGTVAVLAEWGAHVRTPAAATGRFRAAWDEMVPLADTNGHAHGFADMYTGNVCNQCGGVRMRRAGACELCEDCGTSSGCG